MILTTLEIMSPNYPLPYAGHQSCSYTVMTEPGSQILVNFLDLHLPEADRDQNCITDFVKLKEATSSVASFVGSDGKIFCGQRLPNAPGPSVLTSGKKVKYIFGYKPVI